LAREFSSMYSAAVRAPASRANSDRSIRARIEWFKLFVTEVMGLSIRVKVAAVVNKL
jgi:hypothetical protein